MYQTSTEVHELIKKHKLHLHRSVDNLSPSIRGQLWSEL